MAARLGKLRLTPEETVSPRRAGSFTLKSFEGLGELEASLAELGSRKLNEKTLLKLTIEVAADSTLLGSLGLEFFKEIVRVLRIQHKSM